MARPIPELDELVTLIQASLGNAGELLSDARLLLVAGRAPRAHALATLAFEEIGKAFICILAVVPSSAPLFGIRSEGDFWKAWNSHTDKLAWARGFLFLLIREPSASVADTVTRLANTSLADHLRKMRGLYVDYADGSVLVPSDVTSAEAAELASDVQAVLDIATSVWGHDGMRERLHELREQYADQFSNLLTLAAEVIARDPDAALDATRQMLQDGLQTMGNTTELAG
jgi:AbiV family abortive infection protein